MSYVVEKGVPLPGGDNRTKYPFKQMEVGDSFVFEWIPQPSNSACSKVAQAARQYGKLNGMKFSIKKMEDGKGRCWRVA